MPIYEYRCLDCGRVTEFLVRSQGQRLRYPHCGSYSLEKLLSVPYVMSSRGYEAAERTTCCGRDTPCEIPPCASTGTCRRG